MAKKLVLFDTSIFIDFFRKSDKAKSRLLKWVKEVFIFCISAITEFEIHIGTAPDQTDYREDFLFRTQVLAFELKNCKSCINP